MANKKIKKDDIVIRTDDKNVYKGKNLRPNLVTKDKGSKVDFERLSKKPRNNTKEPKKFKVKWFNIISKKEETSYRRRELKRDVSKEQLKKIGRKTKKKTD